MNNLLVNTYLSAVVQIFTRDLSINWRRSSNIFIKCSFSVSSSFSKASSFSFASTVFFKFQNDGKYRNYNHFQTKHLPDCWRLKSFPEFLSIFSTFSSLPSSFKLKMKYVWIILKLFYVWQKFLTFIKPKKKLNNSISYVSYFMIR